MQRIWVIIGATSIIAEEFARLAAAHGHGLRLVGRNPDPLHLIAKDINIRYKIPCEVFTMDLSHWHQKILHALRSDQTELDLFIAASNLTENDQLTTESINQLIQTNVLSITQLLHAYFTTPQKRHQLIYLSSVAACRGRAKNSLYGGSKAAIEIYLEGLQQKATKNQRICIARLGFIDTKQTYGLPGLIGSAPPDACARACWKALKRNKRVIYYPKFWRMIMAIINRLPFFFYKRISHL